MLPNLQFTCIISACGPGHCIREYLGGFHVLHVALSLGTYVFGKALELDSGVKKIKSIETLSLTELAS